MMDYDDVDEDLPWDGLWEYVLGDEDDDIPRRPSSFRRQRSDEVSPDFTQFLLSDDPNPSKKQSNEKKKSETRRRLSFPRQSSFGRQTSNQSTSTNGSSSSRLKGILGRGKKKEDTSASIFPSITIESRDDSGASRKSTRENPPSLLDRLSSSFDDTLEESQDLFASPPKKERKKPFWKKREIKKSRNSESGDSLFQISSIVGGTQTETNTKDMSNKKEKRKVFWKRNEKSSSAAAASQQPSHDKFSEWDEDIPDDESSDLESIDGLLGPWHGGSVSIKEEEIHTSGGMRKSFKSSHKKSVKSDEIQPVPSVSSTRDSKSRASLLKAVTRLGGRSGGKRENSFSSQRSQEKTTQNRTISGNGKVPSTTDDDGVSFLPQSLVPWQNEDDKSESTESTKSDSLSQQNESLSSASVELSEKRVAKKGVSWAEDNQSTGQESDGLGVSFADIRSWLYSAHSFSDEDSESSMTSSPNQSFQSEDLSSEPTESDLSTGAASSKDDSDGEEAQTIRQPEPTETQDSSTAVQAEKSSTCAKSPEGAANKQDMRSTSQNHCPPEDRITRIEPLINESPDQESSRSVNVAIIQSTSEKDNVDAPSYPREKSSSKAKKERKQISSERNVKKKDKARKKKTREQRIQFCKALRSLSDEDIVRVMESGLPVHELTYEELAEIFPKIRMVADEHVSDQASVVLGNANSFDDSRPAFLQLPSKAIKPGLGLQSLYEYDYASGKHMKVVYESCGADPKSSLQIQSYDIPPEVKDVKFAIIQVEASTISNTDCRTRRDGWLGNKRIELPNTPGVDIVGKIYRIDHESSKQLGLSKGDRIVSLVSQGGNSRFLPVNPTSLVKISEKVDPAEAVCLVETYLTAFQTLHHNQSFLTRYRKNSLLGKTILVIGGMSAIMARSMSQLAQYAGCKATFATSQKRDFKNLSENGILPLPLDPVEWWEQLAGAVDILISLDEEVIPLHHKLLKLDGTVVVSSTHFHEDLLNEGIQTSQRKLICSTAKSRALSQTTRYDLYEEWEANPGRVKKDLAYLIDLLEKRKVIPKVIDRVPLEKVAEIQELLEKRRAKGHYVCEPWLVSKSRAVSL